MNHAPHCCHCWAAVRVSASAVCDRFPSGAVLLCCECEGDGGSCLDLADWCCHCVEWSVVKVQSDVVQSEGGVICGGSGAFSWSQEEAKSDDC